MDRRQATKPFDQRPELHPFQQELIVYEDKQILPVPPPHARVIPELLPDNITHPEPIITEERGPMSLPTLNWVARCWPLLLRDRRRKNYNGREGRQVTLA